MTGKRHVYLYLIRNCVNGKRYVGITNNVSRRWREHKSGHGSSLVRAAIRKYGQANILFEPICCGDAHYIKDLEQRVIRLLGSKVPDGYNLTDGGDGAIGCSPSDATRHLIRMSKLGKRRSAETCEKMRAACLGKKHSDETRQKMRAARQGSDSYNAKRVVIDGIQYESGKAAALALGVSPASIYQRLYRCRRRVSGINNSALRDHLRKERLKSS